MLPLGNTVNIMGGNTNNDMMDESVMNYPTKLLYTNPPLKGDIGGCKKLTN